MLKRTRSNWQAINPDIVMFNGNIITVDNEFSLAEAIAIKGATIIGVCSSIDIRKLAGENTRQIDLQGVTDLSGINDAHCHLNGFGLERPPMMVGLGYPSITSIADIKTATADKAAETSPGKWISGWGWDRGSLDELKRQPQAWPTRFDIDSTSPDNPVMYKQLNRRYFVKLTPPEK